VHGAVSREASEAVWRMCGVAAQQEGHKNCRDCLVQSEPNSFKITLVIGRPSCLLGQRCAGIDEIDTIFQGSRSRRSSMAPRGDARPRRRNELARCRIRTVDRIGESSRSYCLWISHSAPPQTASSQTTDRSTGASCTVGKGRSQSTGAPHVCQSSNDAIGGTYLSFFP